MKDRYDNPLATASAIWRMEDVAGHTTTVLGDEDVRLAIVQLQGEGHG